MLLNEDAVLEMSVGVAQKRKSAAEATKVCKKKLTEAQHKTASFCKRVCAERKQTAGWLRFALSSISKLLEARKNRDDDVLEKNSYLGVLYKVCRFKLVWHL